jgi:hypothetical protein
MAVTQQMLTEATEAYHALLTGTAVVEFRDQNGETVKYSRANKNDLKAYIDMLKVELGQTAAPTGPMRVWM